MRTRSTLFCLAGIASLAGCALGDAGPKERDVPSLLINGSDTSQIVAPDTVASGAPFDVTFSSYGGGCRSKGTTQATVSVSTVRIFGTDHDSGAEVCTRILNLFEHAVQVRIDATGPATIRVVGVQDHGEPVELTRTLIVR